MIHICSLNSISPSPIRTIQGQKIVSVIVSANTELSVRLMTLSAVHFLCSSSTSSSSPKSGWLQLDWTLYNGRVICDNHSSLCYSLHWTWLSLEFKPCDTNMHVTPAVSTKSLTHTWPPHPCLVLWGWNRVSINSGRDPKATFNIFQKQGTLSIFV